jgi:hypothetical protein
MTRLRLRLRRRLPVVCGSSPLAACSTTPAERAADAVIALPERRGLFAGGLALAASTDPSMRGWHLQIAEFDCRRDLCVLQFKPLLCAIPHSETSCSSCS